MFSKNRNKNKSCIEKTVPMVMVRKPEEPWGYVEIVPLSQRLLRLNQLAHFIEEMPVTDEVNQAGLTNYKLSLKEAYLAEFERDYTEIFCKTISYTDYKRTQSTL